MGSLPILGYWKIRGLAQAIRLLFHYLDQEYIEELYEAGGPPDFSREPWLQHKFTKGLDFPNLPYLIDDGFKITQSGAILEYVADKYGMLPTSARERAVLLMLQAELSDFRTSYARLVYNPDFNKLKQGFLDDLPQKLRLWSNYLGNKQWLTGENIQYPDFNLYDLLDALRTLEPTCLNDFPNLQKYMERFEDLDKIKEFQKSDAYIARPFNNTAAAWRGDA
uniref:glutathione transferase n=1 Tax=Schistocephalus solidus TaxID=70667 RepID=A0A0X3PXB4_SCHSO